MIVDAILRAFQEMHERKWDTLFFAVDLHGTIIKRYTDNDIEPYEGAEETLKYLSDRKDIVLILYTSSYLENLHSFYKWCDERGIVFKYLNENPDCPSNKTGDFSTKFYFNVLIDDRAGFEPEDNGWEKILESIKLGTWMLEGWRAEETKN